MLCCVWFRIVRIMDIWQIIKLRIFSSFYNIFKNTDSVREYNFERLSNSIDFVRF